MRLVGSSFFVALAPILAVACGNGNGGTTDGDAGCPAGDVTCEPPPADACEDYDPLAYNLYWGELHLHSKVSFDSYWFNQLNGPREAYAFAKGEAVHMPCTSSDDGCITRRLDAPLDFMALTEHAEFLGGFNSVCDGPDPDPACPGVGQFILDNVPEFIAGNLTAGPDTLIQIFDERDPGDVWAELQDIAEDEYERCGFTTLNAYEYSPIYSGSMMHRNVFFVGDQLPERVVSLLDTIDEWELHGILERECGEVEGCDYITIPHNSNLSDGRMFRSSTNPGAAAGRGGTAITREDAELRARVEPLFEIMQHKGQSECMPGFGFDLLAGEEIDGDCFFERTKPICLGSPDDPPTCTPPPETVCATLTADPEVTNTPEDCTAPLDFARGILAEGLRVRDDVGANPFKLGFVGATDGHNGTPANVNENDWRGHGGSLDYPSTVRLGRWCEPGETVCDEGDFYRSAAYDFNPGGVTGAWATQNTREAIFEAFRARRTYATSGPRIRARFYADYTLGSDACEKLAAGEASALASSTFMGSVLPPADRFAPSFVVWAAQDPGGERTMGAPLERLQIIKGWVEGGDLRAKVFEIAGAKDGPAPAADCSIERAGRPEQLCGTWTDPEFDLSANAYYYVRVLEQPTCRWSTHECVQNGVDCSELGADGRFVGATGFAGYEGCCDIAEQPDGTYVGTNRFEVVQERAWTSPIWYEPAT